MKKILLSLMLAVGLVGCTDCKEKREVWQVVYYDGSHEDFIIHTSCNSEVILNNGCVKKTMYPYPIVCGVRGINLISSTVSQ